MFCLLGGTARNILIGDLYQLVVPLKSGLGNDMARIVTVANQPNIPIENIITTMSWETSPSLSLK